MSLDTYGVSALVREIYRAGFGEIEWDAAIAPIVRALNCKAGVLCILDRCDGVLSYESSGIEKSAISSYLKSDFGKKDPRIRAFTDDPRDGVYYDLKYYEEDQIRRDEYYRWQIEHTGTKFFVGLKMTFAERPTSLLAGLTFFRDYKKNHVSKTEIDLLSQLWPHLHQAIRGGFLLERKHSGIEALKAYLEMLPNAALLLNGAGKVIYANSPCEEIGGRRDGLDFRSGKITAHRECDTRRLNEIIVAALEYARGFEALPGGRLLVKRDGFNAGDYLVNVTPLPGSENIFSNSMRAAVVSIKQMTAELSPKLRQSLLCLYGLTDRQIDLTTALFAGTSLGESANAIGVSRNTAKIHLKNIFEKTGVARQADLVKLVSQLV